MSNGTFLSADSFVGRTIGTVIGAGLVGLAITHIVVHVVWEDIEKRVPFLKRLSNSV